MYFNILEIMGENVKYQILKYRQIELIFRYF
jgi:hypothetical protein